MQEYIEKIKNQITEHCRAREKAEIRETTDINGNPNFHWQTSLVLEVRAQNASSQEEISTFTQAVPVQFDLCFDLVNHKVMVFLQWGQVEENIWLRAQPVIYDQLEDQVDKSVKYHKDREVVELAAIYPSHEFEFSYVYEEIVSYFGLVNSVFFEKAQQSSGEN